MATIKGGKSALSLVSPKGVKPQHINNRDNPLIPSNINTDYIVVGECLKAQ